MKFVLLLLFIAFFPTVMSYFLKPGMEDDVEFQKRYYWYSRWNSGKKKDFTYSIQQAEHTTDLTVDAVRQTVAEAFTYWSDAADLTFTYIDDINNADMKIKFATGAHGDYKPFDGLMGVLAHAYYPHTTNMAGEIHFDDAENFMLGNGSIYDGINLKFVATHEIGHSLGLGHSGRAGTVMQASYMNPDDLELWQDDIRGIQFLYGANANDECVLGTHNCNSVNQECRNTKASFRCIQKRCYKKMLDMLSGDCVYKPDIQGFNRYGYKVEEGNPLMINLTIKNDVKDVTVSLNGRQLVEPADVIITNIDEAYSILIEDISRDDTGVLEITAAYGSVKDTESTDLTVYFPPSAPTDFTLQRVQGSTFGTEFSWSPSSEHDTNQITYKLYYKEEGATVWIGMGGTYDTYKKIGWFDLVGGRSSVTLNFKVVATNRYSGSNALGSVILTHTYVQPSAPTDFEVEKAERRNDIDFTWNPPMNVGSLNIRRYWLSYKKADENEWTKVKARKSMDVEDLLVGSSTTYDFKVAAEDDFFYGVESDIVTFTLYDEWEPPVINSLDLTTDNFGIAQVGGKATITARVNLKPSMVQWILNDETLVESDSISFGWDGNNPTLTISNLTNSHAGTVKVIVTNVQGSAEKSIPITIEECTDSYEACVEAQVCANYPEQTQRYYCSKTCGFC